MYVLINTRRYIKALSVLAVVIMTFLSCHPQAPNKETLKTRAAEAKLYCQDKGLNANICILADMSIHSGKNRFTLWDMKKDSALLSCLCSHGCGEDTWGSDETKTAPVFSNTPDTHCSSLGKYKIGARGWSNWGIHVNYKLHGLDSSNSKAYERLIVLHSWDAVPETAPYPNGTPEGWGCPAISNGNLQKLNPYLTEAERPVLLWIFQ